MGASTWAFQSGRFKVSLSKWAFQSAINVGVLKSVSKVRVSKWAFQSKRFKMLVRVQPDVSKSELRTGRYEVRASKRAFQKAAFESGSVFQSGRFKSG